jgi:hypothetical protein
LTRDNAVGAGAKFYEAYSNAKRPVELHIYAHGGHAGWHQSAKRNTFLNLAVPLVDWANDLRYKIPTASDPRSRAPAQ